MYNNNEDFVSFETAKAMRTGGYPQRKKENAYAGSKYNIYGELTTAPFAEHFAAPTLWEAHKHLRKKFGIDIVTFHERLPEDCYWSRIEHNLLTVYEQEPIYNSFEKSLDAAIRYCYENKICNE